MKPVYKIINVGNENFLYEVFRKLSANEVERWEEQDAILWFENEPWIFVTSSPSEDDCNIFIERAHQGIDMLKNM